MDFDSFANTYSPEPDAALSMKVIEERYNIENTLIAAVSEGDADKALRCKSQLKVYQEQRVEDRQRNNKNYLIVFNTLLRKAVENGYVHPAHIDAVAADFARRIEGVTNFSELNRLADVMIRRYCSLVKEFSLHHYSPLIRDVINAVDFNLPEPLSLTSLAKQFTDPAIFVQTLIVVEKISIVTNSLYYKELTSIDYFLILSVVKITVAGSVMLTPAIFQSGLNGKRECLLLII